MRLKTMLAAAAMLAVLVGMNLPAQAFEKGDIQLQSAGPLAFGPQATLLVGDPKAAAIYAIETDDDSGSAAGAKINIQDLTGAIKSALKANNVNIADMVVNPQSGNVYLSVSTNGPAKGASIVKVGTDGKVSEFSTEDVRYTKATLVDAPEDKLVEGRRGRKTNPRMESITDLAFMDGQVLVSGISTADSPSSIRALSYPFTESDPGTSLEIYHGNHGRYEDSRSVNAFVPFNIDGEPTVLAAYTCTPLVKFPVKELVSGKKVRGTTVAELGNHNRALDIIVYKKDGQEFLLMANNPRGVMKVSTKDIGRKEGITQRVSAETAGQHYHTIGNLKNVTQLDKLNDTAAVVITENDGKATLTTIALP